jgi:DNA-binding transcriptional ArsR family regulator|tara:strand:- start:611 stop:964 length:354 start_codon:yes stop_codon:yes gene_type:complete
MQLSVAVRALSSLSQETRLSIFRMLVTAGPDGVAAGKIAEGLNIPPSTLSFHLTHLANAELVIPQRLNRSIIYKANYDQMSKLLQFLTEDCCRGQKEICSEVFNGLKVLQKKDYDNV